MMTRPLLAFAALATTLVLPTAASGESIQIAANLPVTASAQAVRLDLADTTGAPTGNLPGWTQVFREDFNTPVTQGKFLASPYYTSGRFKAYNGSRDTSRHGVYSPEIISVENGILTKHIRTVNGVPRVAAILPQVPGSHVYGRFSLRMRTDYLPNYKIAYLLWPDGGWPVHDAEGEIDYPENDLGDDLLRGFVHWTNQDTSIPRQQHVYHKTPFSNSAWHDYTIEWAPNRVSFFLDGVKVATYTTRIPRTRFHWVLQAETALGNGSPMPAASTAGRIQIAWVAAWTYTP